jgi:hypothetical protein
VSALLGYSHASVTGITKREWLVVDGHRQSLLIAFQRANAVRFPSVPPERRPRRCCCIEKIVLTDPLRFVVQMALDVIER